MRVFKRFVALLATLTLVIGCTVAGLVLPVSAAEGDTFKLSAETLYLGDGTSSWSLTAAVKALNLDGTDYTAETLSWTSSNSAISTYAIDTNTVRVRVAKGKAIGTTTTITFASSSGERHSCDVIVAFDGEKISGGDFESATLCASNYQWGALITNGASRVVDEDDPSGTNHVLKIPGNISKDAYYKGLPIVAGKKYKVSFDIKGIEGNTGNMFFVYTGKGVSVSNAVNLYSSSGWYYFKSKKSEWTHVEFVLTAKSTYTDSNQSYIFDLKNPASEAVYLDNFSMYELGTAESISLSASDVSMEIGDEAALLVSASPEGATFNRVQWSTSDDQVATVDNNGKISALGAGTATITAKSGVLDAVTCTVKVYEEMLAAVPDPSLENGAVEIEGGAFGEVQPEDVVTVTVTPEDGYVMVPGSLRYTMKDGTVVRVLNKDLSDADLFGQGDGNTFRFVMPNEKVTLTAEFISTAEQNFAANTIGTSCRYTVGEDGEKVYDGIRFLTRLNLANKFDAESDTLTVTYGGEEYTVLELGSLLKREQSIVALTYENAVANQAVSGTDKMWVSKAYTADSGLFKLVDYTEAYIDFSSVMLTNHYDRFYTARGYMRLQAADGAIVTLEFDEITNSISSVVPILPPVQTVDGVTAEKSCWTPIAHTVAPGEKITYQIDVTAGATAGTVTVFEPIPANTVYVEGADKLVGKTAVWELDLAAGEKRTLTYTVQVVNSIDLCKGGTVEFTDTQVGDTTFEIDETRYIERTVNSADAYYVNMAIQALADSTYADLNFVYWVYTVAFSSSYTGYHTESVYKGFSATQLLDSVIHGNGVLSYSYEDSSSGKDVNGSSNQLDNIAPTLYGGTEVTGQISGLKGAPATSVSESDLMIGDVVIVKNAGAVSLYIYCDKGLLKIKESGGAEKADATVLDTLTTSQAYVVLRPRTGLTSVTSSNPEEQPAKETYTDYQKALVSTAEAYLMRGQKVQYADTTFGWTGPSTVDGGYMEYRWRLREDTPEDATEQYYKYINCSSFCHDVYYFGLNYRLFNGYDSYTCNQMVTNSASNRADLRKFYFTRATSDVHSEEQMSQVEEEFMSTIQPGDLLLILRTDAGSAHVMMYIGNGKMIHATGNLYRYGSNGKPAIENPEPSIRYHQVWDYFFRPTSSNYAFGANLTTLAIVRPLDDFNKAIPENTNNRIENLTGIVAQKLASHRAANTVSPGDNVTFTFDIRNTNDESKTLVITDTVPAGTTYVSGADTVNGDALNWTVTVPSNSTVTVSYSVQVNADTASGTKLLTTATIGGVAFECPEITVGNTLTKDEQTAIRNAVAAIKSEGTTLTGIELVNAIYERAGLDYTFSETDLATIMTGERGVFTELEEKANYYKLSTSTESSVYRNMVAPTLYGGNNVFSPRWQHDRTRLAHEADLVIGDIIVTRDAAMYEQFMYVGDGVMFSLTTAKDDTISAEVRMERLLGRREAGYYRRYFAVLRPSLTNGSMPVEVTE